MIDLLSLHKQFILTHLRPGDAAADFTMGNGYDTEFLSKAVGEAGRVYAFDVQPQALECTAAHLRETGCPENYRLILDSHSNAAQYIKEPIRAGMFNLGWLPGGDKRVTTHWETTRTAILAALNLLCEGGVCVICAYPGHAEGDREREALVSLLANLPPQQYNVLRQKFLNAGPGAPECFVIQRQ